MTTAVLIYNEEAGSSNKTTPEALLAALTEAGFQATQLQTRQEEDLDVLLEFSGVVFVAGGDGTLRGVAKRLVGRHDVRLAPIPMGTSNNIAHTLNLLDSPEEVARSYRRTHELAFDAGLIDAPWGPDIFFEACGCGVFADVLAAYDPEQQKSPVRAAQALIRTLPGFQPLPLALELDDVPQPETPLALLEVMNTRATGNSMKLATSADPHDGLLDVVQVNGEQRDSFLAYLGALLRDDFEALPSVLAAPVRTVQIPYLGQAFHVDGEVRAADPAFSAKDHPAKVQIKVWPGALPLLLPEQP